MTTWSRASSHHLESSCGRWTIAKVVVNSTPQYELWSRVPRRLMAGKCLSADAAKDAHRSLAKETT